MHHNPHQSPRGEKGEASMVTSVGLASIPAARSIVANFLFHEDGNRMRLDEFIFRGRTGTLPADIAHVYEAMGRFL
jgi:hypothetical protein